MVLGKSRDAGRKGRGGAGVIKFSCFSRFEFDLQGGKVALECLLTFWGWEADFRHIEG